MKLITTVIRPEKLHDVKTALFRAGVTGITITRVSGHGGEKELVEHYRASNVVLEFREKIKIEMVCSEPFVEPTIRAILASARTGAGGGRQDLRPADRIGDPDPHRRTRQRRADPGHRGGSAAPRAGGGGRVRGCGARLPTAAVTAPDARGSSSATAFRWVDSRGGGRCMFPPTT